jgi:hypothetical protein
MEKTTPLRTEECFFESEPGGADGLALLMKTSLAVGGMESNLKRAVSHILKHQEAAADRRQASRVA